MKRILLALILSGPVAAFAQTAVDTFNPIPSLGANFNSQLATFLRNEDAQRFNENFTSYVESQCIMTVAGAVGKTGNFTSTPCVAYPGGYRISEPASSINFGTVGAADDGVCWVIATRDASGTVGTFARVGTTHFAVDCVSGIQPTLPSNAVYLMRVTFAGGSISAILDMRRRSPVGDDAIFLDVRDFGALCDGVTDDAASIQSALDEAVSHGGGTVVIPSGDTCAISSTLTVLERVSLIGVGTSTLKALTTGMTMVSVGGTYGRIQDLLIDGNSLADVGLLSTLSVQRHFENIRVIHARRWGIHQVTDQNCEWVGVNAEHSGALKTCAGGSKAGKQCEEDDDTWGSGCPGSTCSVSPAAQVCWNDAGHTSDWPCAAGWMLSDGVGNNLYSRVEISNNAPYQLVMWDNPDVVNTGGGAAATSINTWIKAVIERPVNPTGAPAINALLYQRSGNDNQFINTNFSLSTPGSVPVFDMNGVVIADDDKTYGVTATAPGTTSFIGGSYSMSSGANKAFKLNGAFRVEVDYMNFVSGNPTNSVVFYPDSTSQVNTGLFNQWANSNLVLCTPQSGTCDAIVDGGRPFFRMVMKRVTSGDEILNYGVYGESNWRFKSYANGQMSWGDGTNPQDVTLIRYVFPSGQVGLRLAQPWAIQGTSSGVYGGAGSPNGVVTAKMGSLYINTSGGAGTTLYMKESGDNTNTGWISPTRPTQGGQLIIAAGVVTKTVNYHKIETESAAATDDLDTINGGVIGDVLVLSAWNTGHTVVLTEAGNLKLSAATLSLDNDEDAATFIYTGTKWLLTSFSDNGA